MVRGAKKGGSGSLLIGNKDITIDNIDLTFLGVLICRVLHVQ